jgi:hypothetical protein
MGSSEKLRPLGALILFYYCLHSSQNEEKKKEGR